MREPVFDEEYRHHRNELAECLPTPDFAIGGHGTYVTEAFVSNQTLGMLTESERIEATESLLVSLRCLLERPPRYSDALPELYTSRLEQLWEALPQDLNQFLDRSFLREVLLEGPFLPAHGDLVPKNIVLSANRQPVVIDLPTSSLSCPFWYDSVKLVTTCTPQAFLNGHFDDALASLFAAAGFCDFDASVHRARLVAARVLLSDSSLQNLSLPPRPMDERRRSMQDRWNRYRLLADAC